MTMCQQCLEMVGDGNVPRMPWGFRWFGWDLVKPDGVPQHALVSPIVLFSMPVELCQIDKRFKELAQMAWLEQRDKERAIAEAVAAEREACCAAMCGLCAGINPDYGPAVYEAPPLGTMPPFWQHPHISTGNPWEAVPCHAAAIRDRTGEKVEVVR